MIGYKATNLDGNCRGFHFEVGKTYTKDTKKEYMRCCTDTVFHFCRELQAIERESPYKLSESRIFEVIAGDYVRDGGKYGTNSLTILREIVGDEKAELLNSGINNTGNYNSGTNNTGDYNSGTNNTGDYNSGDWNTGDCNSGSYNSGDWNSGINNTGDYNSGHCNSGCYNSGTHNSGDCNSGHWNSGSYNSGTHNSGNFNSGDCNSGHWNSGNYNAGFFNLDEPKVRIFGKETDIKREDILFPDWLYFELTTWVSRDAATEDEKAEHKQEIETCGGFLKTLEYKEAFKLAYSKTNDTEKCELFDLPNFDKDIFEEISGVDVSADYERLRGDK